MPDQDRELAGDRDDGDPGTPTSLQTREGDGQRAGCPDGGMGGLGEQAPGMGLALPPDVAAIRWAVSRLTDPGIEPEAADQLGRSAEPADVAHHRDDARGGHEADPRDGQHVPDAGVVDDRLRDDTVGRGDLGADGRLDPERGIERQPLLGRQLEGRQPGPAARPERIGHR